MIAPLPKFTAGDEDYFFVQFNLLNGLFNAHCAVSAQYLQELQNWVSTKHSVLVNLLISGSAVTVAGLILLLPFFVLVNHTQQEVLTLFLDIPLSKARRLYGVCNRFLNHLQSGNDEDL